MRVSVTPEVVAGTDRGGEDLFLCFRATHDGDTPPVDEPVECVLYTRDDWDGLTEVRGELDGDDDSAYLDVHVYYRSCHYDFEWEGDGAAALALEFKDYSDYRQGGEVHTRTVLEHFQNPANWSFCHKPGQSPKLRCELQHYVNGNAE